jgi:hypothetical protein
MRLCRFWVFLRDATLRIVHNTHNQQQAIDTTFILSIVES